MIIENLIPNNLNDKNIVCNELFKFMFQDFKKFYPKFFDWYNLKVVKEFLTGERKIFIITSNANIYGVSIVKVGTENKICSFFLLPEIRKNGFGTELLSKSIDCFQVNKQLPIVTVPEERLAEKINRKYTFTAFLQNNGFNISDKKVGVYRSGKEEFIFTYNVKKQTSTRPNPVHYR